MNLTNIYLEVNLIEFQQGLCPNLLPNLSLVNLPKKTSNLNIEIDNEMPISEDYGLKPARADYHWLLESHEFRISEQEGC